MSKFICSNERLKTHIECGNLSEKGITEILEMGKKEKQLQTIIDLDTIKYREDKNLYYIYIDRKQVSAKTQDDLINKLYENLFGKQTYTLTKLFPEWVKYRHKYETCSDKSLSIYISCWENFYVGSELLDMPIKDIRASDIDDFFQSKVGYRKMTRKSFNDKKLVLNSVLSYAVKQNLIDRNLLRDLSFPELKFKGINKGESTKPFTLQERQLILNYLKDSEDIYFLAIQLQFYLFARIGEVKSLKWVDIGVDVHNQPYIRLQSQLLDQKKLNIETMTFEKTEHIIVDYTKSATEEGYRDIPLADGGVKILDRIKKITGDSENLFELDGRLLSTVTYNRRIKEMCASLGIAYRSSHKIRFCVASGAYSEGISATKIQTLLGHTTLGMSLHYLKDIEVEDKVNQELRAILG